MVTVVQFSSPGKEAGMGLLPVTVMVKSEGTAVPESSLMTILHTLSVASLVLVKVQVTVSPALTSIALTRPAIPAAVASRTRRRWPRGARRLSLPPAARSLGPRPNRPRIQSAD